MTSSARLKAVTTMLSLAQVGYAEWFFGNLYEAIVRVPNLLADGHLASILGAGSPVLYYLPGAVISFGATLAAVITGWKSHRVRRLLVVMTLALLFGGVATAYLVQAVNLKLFVHGNSISYAEGSRMLNTWYQINMLRLVTTACAWLLAASIKRSLRSQTLD